MSRIGSELRIHGEAARHFLGRGLAYMAQAVAFQALLSFVPFLLLVASFWGHWLGGDAAASRRINAALRLVLPFNAPVVNRSLEALVAHPGLYTAVSLAALLWLAGSVFRTVDYSINLAFETQEKLGPIVAQCKGLLLMFLFGVLLGLWVLALSIVAVLPERLPGLGPLSALSEGLLSGVLAPILVKVALFTALYHLLPHRPVAWRDALRGGVLAAVSLHVALRLYGLVLQHTMSYSLLSGTVAALVAFLLWIYWASCIFLYGAALVHVLTRRRRAIS